MIKSNNLSEENLNLDNSIEFQGLTQQIKCSNYLMPLFEAIVNAIQSIQINKIKNGKIDIYIERDNDVQLTLSSKFSSKIQPIKNIFITDNGIGFNDENLQHFRQVFTTHKQKYGCKGIGRVLWLKAFTEVKISSIYKKDSQYWDRSFIYKLPNGIVKKSYKHSVSSLKKLSTCIKLLGLKNEYTNNSKQKIETIAQRIIEHCFEYFVGKNLMPQITLSGYDDSRTQKEIKICLNEYFKELYENNIKTEIITIKNNDFTLKHVKLFNSNEISNHKLYYCANERAVKNELLKNITGLANLENKILDTTTNKEFYYTVYISSNYFDNKVDYIRENLDILEKSPLDLPDYLSFEDIRKNISKNIKEFISPYLDIIKAKKRQYIKEVIDKRIPQYKYILEESDNFFDDISPSIKEDSLVAKIRLKHFKKKEDLNSKFQALIEEKKRHGIKDTEEYIQKYQDFVTSINKVNGADLSEYVIHRKTILNLLEMYLAWQENTTNSYKEEAIHNLIYPMGLSSDTTSYDNHNLWIIDDRLAFQEYITSDISLKKNKNLNIDNSDEPDLFFNNKVLYSDYNNIATFDAITLVEFKRPLRDNYTTDKNPIDQIYTYIEKLKSKKVNKENGRTINVNDNTRFFVYIICDITNSLEKILDKYEYKRTIDAGGYFRIHSNYNAYIEIISFDKLLADAKKRNNILFEKLGLS